MTEVVLRIDALVYVCDCNSKPEKYAELSKSHKLISNYSLRGSVNNLNLIIDKKLFLND